MFTLTKTQDGLVQCSQSLILKINSYHELNFGFCFLLLSLKVLEKKIFIFFGTFSELYFSFGTSLICLQGGWWEEETEQHQADFENKNFFTPTALSSC